MVEAVNMDQDQKPSEIKTEWPIFFYMVVDGGYSIWLNETGQTWHSNAHRSPPSNLFKWNGIDPEKHDTMRRVASHNYASMQAFVHVMKSIEKHLKETMSPEEAKDLYLKQARKMSCTHYLMTFANINDQY